MDPLADKILVTSALFVIAALGFTYFWMVWVITIRDAVITINRIFALQVGKPIITHVLAKWKTMLQMVTIFMILIYINILNLIGAGANSYELSYWDPIGISMLIVTLITVLSGVFYIIENRELLVNMLRKIVRLQDKIGR